MAASVHDRSAIEHMPINCKEEEENC